jgi:tetratricopeptide (TPR) repeat protein
LVKLRQGDVGEADIAFLERTADARAVQGMMNSPAGPYWALASAENDLLQGRFQDAIDRLMATLERIQRAGFVVHLPDVLELLARTYRTSGNSEAAYEALAEAIAGAELITCRRMLWVLRAERALWLEQDGHSEAAAEERRLAKPIFDYVADHIGDDELKQSFITADWVRDLKLG